MSDNNNHDQFDQEILDEGEEESGSIEIPVESPEDSSQAEIENLKKKIAEYESKLKYSLADYQNLEKKTKSTIEQQVNAKIDKFILQFLSIYDDFVLAKKVLGEQKVDVSGLDAILKNMNSLLTEYGVKPIGALGEIFNPDYHEAVSIIEDSSLDDGTITKEIRKGYISQNRVIRPTIVEISKKQKLDQKDGEEHG